MSEALLLVSLMLWGLALATALWRALGERRRLSTASPAVAVPDRWRWRALRRHPAVQSLRLARRLYVALGSSTSLQRGLAVLVAAEPPGPLRHALQIRLRHLQGGVRAPPLPRWQGMPLAPCPHSLRVLDDLLTGRSTLQQALADWRVELLSARVASCRGPVARRRGDQ